jgi:hypothetical protein
MLDPNNPDYSNTPASPLRPSYGYAPLDPEGPPSVTILTPFYNAGRGFEETARSVFQQSLQCWEWLIVNDCSTDGYSLQVLDDYRRRDPRIRVIDCPTNGGPSRARNIGYKAARTPYIARSTPTIYSSRRRSRSGTGISRRIPTSDSSRASQSASAPSTTSGPMASIATSGSCKTTLCSRTA